MEGWISLYRKILENPIVCKDAEYFSVWVYLLLEATHKEYPALFKGKKIILKPGQLITGRKSISEKFNISESKVTRILKTLENEHQIEQQTSNKNRLISIVNWSQYQQSEHQIGQQLNNNWTTTEQQLNTNNNVITKQCNNENNKPTNRVVGELATHYSNCFRKMIPPLHSDKLISYVEEGMDLELVKYIMEYSSDKKDPWKYCCKVLENSSRNLINTLADFKANLIAEGDNYGKYSINTQQGYRGTTKETEYRESVGDVQKYYNGDLSKLKDDEEYDF